ncbi:Aspartate-semialdehyde dehydrogenase [hydrothermal vent metagenome]|uniref:aspartate-semialdehyde dehydrogenase n=1 Tax=hydrothermal vent metagenome TaxID=652676 RepID=A0A3B0R6P4_9ZZZZ
MSKDLYNIAVVGATGAVGKEILNVLEQRKFPVGELTLLASERTAGEILTFKGEDYVVGLLDKADFTGVDIGLFSPGGSVSAKYAPVAAAAGCVVVDNTSHFRMDPDVPLVVPEVNPDDVAKYVKKNIIANPNCSTIQMVVALKPIHDAFRIKRIVVSTYQSVSGSGRVAMDELSSQVTDIFSMRSPTKEVYPHQIAFNCLPHIDDFLDSGYTKEEQKMVDETRKIFGDDSIKVSATAVRVPVFVGHGESINIETEDPITAQEVREILSQAPGVEVVDDPSKSLYPLQLNSAECDEVFVGRIRSDDTVENGINMWVVSDNLRKGAALNAVQIAELLIRDYL